MTVSAAKFEVGQIVHHLKFGYRGVVFDVDPYFQGTDEWYEQVARSRPPKDRPWYHVLVHDAAHTTYVAERHLEPDPEGWPHSPPAAGPPLRRFRERPLPHRSHYQLSSRQRYAALQQSIHNGVEFVTMSLCCGAA